MASMSDRHHFHALDSSLACIAGERIAFRIEFNIHDIHGEMNRIVM